MTVTKAPETEEEFHERLQTLIRGAESNDVRIKGGYVIRSEADDYDWEAEITEVVK